MKTEEITRDNTVSAEQTDKLLDVLNTLEVRIKRQNSYKMTFLKGVVYGLGTVIGATLIVALFGGIIAGTLQAITGEVIPVDTLGR